MLRLGHRSFADHALLVMAIVNRTRDSFYDRGATFAEDGPRSSGYARPSRQGADLVDIGGVKAGPGDLDRRRRGDPPHGAVRGHGSGPSSPTW